MFTPQSSVSTVGGGQEQSRWDLDMQRLLKHFELRDNCEWHDHPGLPVCNNRVQLLRSAGIQMECNDNCGKASSWNAKFVGLANSIMNFSGVEAGATQIQNVRKSLACWFS